MYQLTFINRKGRADSRYTTPGYSTILIKGNKEIFDTHFNDMDIEVEGKHCSLVAAELTEFNRQLFRRIAEQALVDEICRLSNRTNLKEEEAKSDDEKFRFVKFLGWFLDGLSNPENLYLGLK